VTNHRGATAVTEAFGEATSFFPTRLVAAPV
jgi:hypothetical protein